MQLTTPSPSPSSSNAVDVADVVYRYPSRQSAFLCDRWSLPKGQHTFLHGNSGSGKSTLLSLLSGIAQPQHGTITLNNTQLNTLTPKQQDSYRAQHIGIVFQQFNLIPYLTVRQNVELASYFAKRSIDITDQLLVMLASLQLPEAILSKTVSQLSVGQQQRVAIMRALINSPQLLLIDEPTSALDANARDGFMQMLMSASQSFESTMIFVSHDSSLRQYFNHHLAVTDICRWGEEGLSC
jgi:putative ABC transport system ATP-binding protein